MTRTGVEFRVGGEVGSSRAGGVASTISRHNGLDEDVNNPAIRGETFQGHWKQMRAIVAQDTVPTGDDIIAVINLLSQMTSLLQMELDAESSRPNSLNLPRTDPQSLSNLLESIREPNTMPCLDVLLSENILFHVLATSRMPIEDRLADQLRRHQLILYEVLLSSNQAANILPHQPFLKPMMELLISFKNPSVCSSMERSSVSKSKSQRGILNVEDTELHLVVVLNQLCKQIVSNSELLHFFFILPDTSIEIKAEESEEQYFLVFSILLNYLHHEGNIGQLARDALLNCMTLSKQDDKLGSYIAKQSNFCTVLATGLSALYSALPRQLPNYWAQDPSFCRVNDDDISATNTPELLAFMESLQFCDEVIKVAHDFVREELQGLIYMGFLVSVLGPALTQTGDEEAMCTTCYLDLFLRRITQPSLLAVFLKFIFVESYDDRNVSDIITIRMGMQNKLSQVTLALFETLVKMHCEDVMVCLILRHLIPLKHLILSERDLIRQPDMHGRAAEKLLSLTPICCQEAESLLQQSNVASPRSLSQMYTSTSRSTNNETLLEDSSNQYATNFNMYLADARCLVRKAHEASLRWQYPYDGLTPPNSCFDIENRAYSSGDDEEDQVENGLKSTQVDGYVLGEVQGSSSDNNAPSSGYTSLALMSTSPTSATTSGPVSLTAEEDREFWSLMKDPTVSEIKLNRVIQKMQMHDELSLASSHTESNLTTSSEVFSKDRKMISQKISNNSATNVGIIRAPQDEIDYTVTSLGCFLDFLLEKIELMASNSLTTNLLVTSILSQLAAMPQPILRSVLLLPEIVFQPSVRSLFTAIASLRQKLDNIMPTLQGAEEAIVLARSFLRERVEPGMSKASPTSAQSSQRRDSNSSRMSVASTITQIGMEASKHKSSIGAAFSSMFRSKKASVGSVSYSKPNRNQKSQSELNRSAPASILNQNEDSRPKKGSHLSREVKMHALAAVLLEEWLLELAAIAQEHSVLQKEAALGIGSCLYKLNICKPDEKAS